MLASLFFSLIRVHKIIGSNTSVSKKYAPLLSRILMIRNIESQHPEDILKPSNPDDFIPMRTRL